MADVFSPDKRSEIMRRIRSKNTSWERNFRSELSRRGLRYRIHYGPSKIDVAFVGSKVAVFLDSCFWHLCPEHRELPKTNRGYWERKLRRNRLRDLKTTDRLKAERWVVLRLWSHDFVSRPEATAGKVERLVRRRRLKATRE
jgi:DNA mismatch endonuclease (patch repair protein)